MKKLFVIILFILLTGCSSLDIITVNDYKTKTWVAYSDVNNGYEFQGRFVSVQYSGVKTVGLRLEEPIGPGWKKFGIIQGDLIMGMADLVFLKDEDWKKAWTVVRHRIGQENLVVGILRITKSSGEYEKEIEWIELKKGK